MNGREGTEALQVGWGGGLRRVADPHHLPGFSGGDPGLPGLCAAGLRLSLRRTVSGAYSWGEHVGKRA